MGNIPLHLLGKPAHTHSHHALPASCVGVTHRLSLCASAEDVQQEWQGIIMKYMLVVFEFSDR